VTSFYTLNSAPPGDLFGSQIETISGGYLNVPVGEESVSLGVIWGRPVRGSGGASGIEPDETFEAVFEQEPEDVLWWQVRDAADSGGGGGLDLTLTSASPDGSVFDLSGDFYLALSPNEAILPLLKDDPIRLRSDNLFFDESLFGRLFTNVGDVDAQLWKAEDIPTPTRTIAVEPSLQPISGNDSAAVPEPSMGLSTLVLLAIGVVAVVKRRLGSANDPV